MKSRLRLGDRTGAPGRQLLLLAALGGLSCLVALGSWSAVGDPEPASPATEEASIAVVTDRSASGGAPSSRQRPAEYASDGVVIKPSSPTSSTLEGPMHPHPITAAHERIYRENSLVGALDRAVDLEDPGRIRELVAEYQRQYPEDVYRLQRGYVIIADCLERLDAAVRARAREFWETEIRSQNRRYVRRHCLDG